MVPILQISNAYPTATALRKRLWCLRFSINRKNRGKRQMNNNKRGLLVFFQAFYTSRVCSVVFLTLFLVITTTITVIKFNDRLFRIRRETTVSVNSRTSLKIIKNNSYFPYSSISRRVDFLLSTCRLANKKTFFTQTRN